MLSEPVSILAVKGDLINLQTSRKAACGKCSLKSGCGQYLLSRDTESFWLNAGGMTVDKSSPQNTFSAGTRARLSIAGDAVARLALLFYMLPLMALLVATLVASVFTVNEAWLAISALGGLTAGLAALPRALRLLSSRCQPVLVSMDTPKFLSELHDES